MAKAAADKPLADKSGKFRVAVPSVLVHSGPGLHYSLVGDVLPGNTEVSVLNIAGYDVWIEFEPGKWICKQLGQNEYLTPV